LSNASTSWSPNPRQVALLEEVRTRGAVSVERLASRLNVTMQTVRRDVQRLSEAGMLLRFHGGVSLPRQAPAVSAWKERQAHRADAKARIARSVAAAIPEGATLMMGWHQRALACLTARSQSAISVWARSDDRVG
jgi:DeoR family glycerol-3-phosphate regulon repressor